MQEAQYRAQQQGMQEPADPAPETYTPELGKELSTAEADAAAGKLALTRWRAGKKEDVVIMLPALGDYSATAPYACLKSKRIRSGIISRP